MGISFKSERIIPKKVPTGPGYSKEGTDRSGAQPDFNLSLIRYQKYDLQSTKINVYKL